jgi:hypothetical protein
MRHGLEKVSYTGNLIRADVKDRANLISSHSSTVELYDLSIDVH